MHKTSCGPNFLDAIQIEPLSNPEELGDIIKACNSLDDVQKRNHIPHCRWLLTLVYNEGLGLSTAER